MRGRRRISVDPAALAAFGWLLIVERSDLGWLSVGAAAVHEMGHLAAARLLGLPMGDCSVGIFGVRIGIAQQMLSYRDEAILAAAGPLANLLSAAAGWGLLRLGCFRPQIERRLLFFMAASLVLACVNLLPLRSFDGGRLLGCAAALFGDRTALRVLDISTFFCVVLLFFLTGLLWLTLTQNFSLLALSAALLIRAVLAVLPAK